MGNSDVDPHLNSNGSITPPEIDSLESHSVEAAIKQRTTELEKTIAMLRLELEDRKRAASILSQERNLVHTLIDALPDLIYVKDTEGRYVLNNRAHLAFLGAEAPEQAAGKTVFDFFPTDLAQRYHDDDVRAIQLGQSLIRDVEPTFDSQDNAMWLSRTKVPLKDSHGTVIGLVGIASDVTRSHQAEESLRESEIRFRSVAQAACDAVITADGNGTIIFWNKAAESIFGYSEEEAVGKCVSMLMPDWLKEFYRPAMESVAEGTDSRLIGHPVELGGLRKDGREFPIEFSVATWKTHAGTFFNATIRDITDRKQAEEALRSANENLERRVAERSAAAEQRSRELAESERTNRKQARILQSILDGMGDGVIVVDERGILRMCNPAAEELLEIVPSSMYGQAWSSLYEPLMPDKISAIPQDDRPLARAMRGEAVNDAELYVRRRGAPEGMWLSATARPLRDEDGSPKGGVLVIHDATDRKRVEAELSQAKEAAEAASRAKSEFLANMSHEIRTPMTAILGFADRMLAPGLGLSELQNSLQIIRRNGQHLLNLINDILDISKIEAGQMKTEKVLCDLPQLLADVRSLMRQRASEQGLEFTVIFDGPIPRHILTDPFRMKQILVNLLGNAIKFTPGGKVSLKVTCHLRSPHAELRFDVTDTGIGMSEEQVKRLFRSFTQADESTTRRFGGTGLGLTISRRLARLLGGDVVVQSKLGVGSTFTATIDAGPLQPTELVRDLHETTEPASSKYGTPAHVELRGHILLAEDGRDNQRLIRAILTDAGATVTLADNGRIAVELASAQPFDLILMDMQMPELDGYRATAELRHRGLTTPIIALTAHAMAEDRDKCLTSGCDGYLTKPVETEVFLQTLSRYLGIPAAAVPQAGDTLKPASARSKTLTRESKAADAAVAHSAAQMATARQSISVDSTTQDPTTPSLTADESTGPIVSSYAGVAKMQGILAEFVGGLPERMAEMLDSLAQQKMDLVKRAAHQLRGAGGGYGFPRMTELAARVEQSIKEEKSLEEITYEIDQLVAFVRRVDGYGAQAESLAAAETP